jgi:hypothetical protein
MIDKILEKKLYFFDISFHFYHLRPKKYILSVIILDFFEMTAQITSKIGSTFLRMDKISDSVTNH